MFQMKTISNGTRVRANHDTFSTVLSSIAANVVIHGDEVWTATADGPEVKAGDKWLHCTDAGFVGWVAYIHKGVPICKELVEITPPPPTTPGEVKRIKADVIEYEAPDGSTWFQNMIPDGPPYQK